MVNQSIVITGASTGIGYTTAQRFLRQGWRVFGSVRKQADAERLQVELGERFTPLLFDVTDADALQRAAAAVDAALGNQKLGALVNNAGYVVSGPLLLLPEDQLRQQLDVNVLGPFRVSQAFGPLLGTDRSRTGAPGRIVQISSVAGKSGFPFMGAYCTSKHALDGMSESLRRELILFGIEVILVAPGAIATPIWEKRDQAGLERYSSTPYGPALKQFAEVLTARAQKNALPPERVADDIWQAVTSKRPRLRYEPIPNKFQEHTLPRLLPRRLVDRGRREEGRRRLGKRGAPGFAVRREIARAVEAIDELFRERTREKELPARRAVLALARQRLGERAERFGPARERLLRFHLGLTDRQATNSQKSTGAR